MTQTSADRLAAVLIGRLAAVHLPVRSAASGAMIVRSTSLGDFVVFIPFLATILQQEQDVHLLLVSRFGNVGARVLPHWRDRIMTIDPTSGRSAASDVRAGRRGLRHGEFRRVLFALQNSEPPVGKLRRLVMTRAVVGPRVPVAGLDALPRLRSRAELEERPEEVALNQALAPFVACGIAPSATRADGAALLGLTDQEVEEAASIVRRLGAGSAPAVAMYVHAKDTRKRWPIERFVEVAGALTRGSGRQLWLIGGVEDTAAAHHVADSLPRGRAIVLAGAADVRATLALLSRCELFVGNDGSATHFAALRGCPCVTVFCNWEVPGLWEPIAAPASRSLRPAWSPARAHGDYGIDTISVAHVRAAIEQITARPTEHSIETIGPGGGTDSVVDLRPRLWKANRMG